VASVAANELEAQGRETAKREERARRRATCRNLEDTRYVVEPSRGSILGGTATPRMIESCCGHSGSPAHLAQRTVRNPADHPHMLARCFLRGCGLGSSLHNPWRNQIVASHSSFCEIVRRRPGNDSSYDEFQRCRKPNGIERSPPAQPSRARENPFLHSFHPNQQCRPVKSPEGVREQTPLMVPCSRSLRLVRTQSRTATPTCVTNLIGEHEEAPTGKRPSCGSVLLLTLVGGPRIVSIERIWKARKGNMSNES
jgi:hypothetical protein